MVPSNYNGIKLKNNRKIKGKSSNTWRLNSTLLTNPWVDDKVTRENFQYIEVNWKIKTTYQNV